jgi:hypothetical protein
VRPSPHPHAPSGVLSSVADKEHITQCKGGITPAKKKDDHNMSSPLLYKTDIGKWADSFLTDTGYDLMSMDGKRKLARPISRPVCR